MPMRKPPPLRGTPRKPPVPHVGHPPEERRVAAVPNPRRPRLVRDVHGGDLLDLFVIFPDLPRPARPTAKVPRTAARSMPAVGRRDPPHR